MEKPFEKKEKTWCCVVFALCAKTTQHQLILPIFRIAALEGTIEREKLSILYYNHEKIKFHRFWQFEIWICFRIARGK